LLLSNEYFHVGQHDLLLLKNQASSMITGIDLVVVTAFHNGYLYIIKHQIWVFKYTPIEQASYKRAIFL
ncbi:hypothetical protein, partial [Escherichia coli]|uniref:hypothetical protein n=1 Tax=Escherichia coli TaxID=562 RepID=UPI003EE2B832